VSPAARHNITGDDPMTLSTLKHTVRGRFFTVEFVKETTEEIRRMTCRFGVKQGLLGGRSNQKPGLAYVWACDAQGRRSFYVRNVITVRANGQVYRGPLYGGAR
jgi:hypothetical protein